METPVLSFFYLKQNSRKPPFVHLTQRMLFNSQDRRDAELEHAASRKLSTSKMNVHSALFVTG